MIVVKFRQWTKFVYWFIYINCSSITHYNVNKLNTDKRYLLSNLDNN